MENIKTNEDNSNINLHIQIGSIAYLIIPLISFLLHDYALYIIAHLLIMNIMNYKINVSLKNKDEKEYDYRKEKYNLILMFSNIGFLLVSTFIVFI